MTVTVEQMEQDMKDVNQFLVAMLERSKKLTDQLTRLTDDCIRCGERIRSMEGQADQLADDISKLRDEIDRTEDEQRREELRRRLGRKLGDADRLKGAIEKQNEKYERCFQRWEELSKEHEALIQDNEIFTRCSAQMEMMLTRYGGNSLQYGMAAHETAVQLSTLPVWREVVGE